MPVFYYTVLMNAWNPWHGCHKTSPGCQNCYMYRRDESVGKDPSVVCRTASFDLPAKRKRDGSYKLAGGREVFTCGTSDFFIEEADEWRDDAWRLIRERPDISFLIITKRIHRLRVGLPRDWGEGYANVRIGCTVENQEMADKRLPIFMQMPAAHRIVICEPILEHIDVSPYLASGKFEYVVAGGESGMEARTCDYRWILSLHAQCWEHRVSFWFKQTGRNFLKDGKRYTILKRLQHSQARKAGLNFTVK